MLSLPEQVRSQAESQPTNSGELKGHPVLGSSFVHQESWPCLPALGQRPRFVVGGHAEKIRCESRRISKCTAIFLNAVSNHVYAY